MTLPNTQLSPSHRKIKYLPCSYCLEVRAKTGLRAGESTRARTPRERAFRTMASSRRVRLEIRAIHHRRDITRQYKTPRRTINLKIAVVLAMTSRTLCMIRARTSRDRIRISSEEEANSNKTGKWTKVPWCKPCSPSSRISFRKKTEMLHRTATTASQPRQRLPVVRVLFKGSTRLSMGGARKKL